MDKELLNKRLEILYKLDSLKDKCDCRAFNSNCDNCKEMAKFGSKLNKLVSKRSKINGEVDSNKSGKKKEAYPVTLTTAEYRRLRKLKLSDTNIAKVFGITTHFILRFKKEKNIKTDKYGFVKNVSIEEKEKIKHLIIRERIRIKNKAKAN